MIKEREEEMTTRELRRHVYGITCVGGEVRYLLNYRNKLYRCTTNDTTLIDRVKSDDAPSHKTVAGTYKQALQVLYRNGIRQHCLDEYSLRKFSEFVYGVRTL